MKDIRTKAARSLREVSRSEVPNSSECTGATDKLQFRSFMTASYRFLVVDENTDSRFLLVRTLMRKFPSAVVQECQSGETATTLAGTERLSAVICHRTFEYDGVTLVRLLRHVNADVPIIMVSGIDRSNEALSAGATRFLNYDEWLRVGTVVAEAMAGIPDPDRSRVTEA